MVQEDSRLLAIVERIEPPLVLLEDGLGRGTSTLAWGESARLRLPWEPSHLGALDRFDPGDEWIGAIAYDLGLPPHARRRDPVLQLPVVELFRPLNRIVLRPGARAACFGPDAERLWRSTPSPVSRAPARTAARVPGSSRLSLDQAAFEAAVRSALEYIRAGDIYQVNLSVSEQFRAAASPWAAYLSLRSINPSPWMGYADFGDWQLVCGSPELLVEVSGGMARARPIAGTRRKTGDPGHDAAMRHELATDVKESAEHVMLVDLARNDLGRVGRYGTVRVAELAVIEEYSHVMHLVSDVRARLRGAARPWDVFRALFPGGTITGAPKIRSMEIIAELEPSARGMYTGALGWWAGGMGQWNILIRTAVMRGGEAVIQAGAGIVADSDPSREWKESLRKAAALREAFGLA
ncbi:MAG TPA: anthranilate synthase component I family protein [Gemmatimonadales bacterium]|nr:anthranilate synthase component I family protein [Gemmatimonadales bacterium]